MKKLLASGMLCFLALNSTYCYSLSFCDTSNKELSSYLQERIRILEAVEVHEDNSFMQGYLIGQTQAYYDILYRIKD